MSHGHSAIIEVASNGYVVRLFDTDGSQTSMSVYPNVCEALLLVAGWICYEPLTIEVKHSSEQA